MRLVVDTNVLLSAVMSSSSGSAEIFALWRSRKFELLTCAEQIEEIARVTRYPKIRARLAPALAGRLVNRLRDVAIVVQNLPEVDVASDPFDNYLLALAEAGQADFLVTGDKALLGLKRYKSTRIVASSALLELLRDPGRRLGS
jgi:putative PIN family toxin of toxin-antitoxin system